MKGSVEPPARIGRQDSDVGAMLKRIMKAMQPRDAAPAAAVPAGERVYAIGDIHGRLDQLEALLAMIDADDAAREPARTHLVLLGDLVDRGPDSAGVIDLAMQLAATRPDVRFLAGNHEELLLTAIEGQPRAMKVLCQVGGRETLLSYGMSRRAYDDATFDDLIEMARAVVPPEHIAFLSAFENAIEIGDYLFVHAGVRPGVELNEQVPADLRWIRREFLDHRGSFGRMVVHGHTITPDVELRPNRIGIDTGAYASGKLTAIALESTDRWFLQTPPDETAGRDAPATNALERVG